MSKINQNALSTRKTKLWNVVLSHYYKHYAYDCEVCKVFERYADTSIEELKEARRLNDSFLSNMRR